MTTQGPVEELERRMHEVMQPEYIGPDNYGRVARDAIALCRSLQQQLAAKTEQEGRLREALQDAATSLETISNQGGMEYLSEIMQIRGYANSRAMVARAALTTDSSGGKP